MNRQDEISKAATQILNERMQDNYLKVSSYYNAHKGSILSDFQRQIISLINQAKMQQETHGKQPIQYVAASFLLSSTITESFDFQLSLMDDLNFLKRSGRAEKWQENSIDMI